MHFSDTMAEHAKKYTNAALNTLVEFIRNYLKIFNIITGLQGATHL
jgi:hypothetical protein